MKTINEVMAKMQINEKPLVSSETVKSPEANSSNEESKKTVSKLSLPLGPGSESQQFRQALLRLDEDHHPRVKEMAMAAEWFVRAMSVQNKTRGTRIAFSGSPGCGKTTAARGIYRFAGRSGVDIQIANRLGHWSALWIDWP